MTVSNSGKCSPGPLDLHPKHPQDSLSGDAPLSPRGSSPKGQGLTRSYSPGGGVLPPLNLSQMQQHSLTQPHAAPCCGRPTKDVLGEDHPPSLPGSRMLGRTCTMSYRLVIEHLLSTGLCQQEALHTTHLHGM